MQYILDRGLDLIRAAQSIQNPLFDSFFIIVTSLGDGLFFLAAFPLLLWCVNYRLGLHIVLLCSLSASCNSMLKNLFSQPRPFELDPSVMIASAGGYGLPSGHAQQSLVFWGSLAPAVSRKWYRTAVIAAVALIGFSRVYLGVHFPTDVLAGWALGGIFLVLHRAFHQKAGVLISGLRLQLQIVLSLAVPLGLLSLRPDSYSAFHVGIMAGAGCGAALKARYLVFSGRASGKTGLLRYLIGITIMLGLMYLPWKSASFHQHTVIISWLSASAVGLWMTLGAPWLFCVLGLGDSRQKHSAEA